MNIAIIIALKALANELDKANERQKLLFQELQHRVANTLQTTIGRLEIVGARMKRSPDEATAILDETIQRMEASADIHRRLNDPSLFSHGLALMLREVAATVIDQSSVSLNIDVEEINLSLDQRSIVAMLVIEVANNAVKHVFLPNLGSCFEIVLRALPNQRAVLKLRDDGPGMVDHGDPTSAGQRLGMRILQGLSDQICGTLSIHSDRGTEVIVEFPA